MRSAWVAFGLLVLSAAATAQQYIISTIAGGVPQPTSAVSMATDASGNVYFASGDRGNSVFKLDPSGALTRVAGTARTNYSGDGGPATSAPLFSPQGVAVDRAGNLFIADKGNQRIRRVSPDGIIATVAGGGSTGLGDGGPATSAQLNYPGGLAVDGAGNLFIGELGRVRKVSPDGIITTVAGGGSTDLGDGGRAIAAQLHYAARVAVDSAGELFIQDQDGDDVRIRKVSPSGIISTVTSDGICCGVIAVDRAGNLFTADGNRVRKTAPNGSSTIVAGNGAYGVSGDGGPATEAQLLGLTALSVDGAGNLFIADGLFFGSSQFRIRKVSPNGIITTVPGGVLGSTPPPTGDGGPATSAQLRLAAPDYGVHSGIAVDRAGNLFIADTDNHRIRKVSPGGIITTVAGVGPCPVQFAKDCLPLGDGGPATSAALLFPTGVAVDSKGNLFIADRGNSRVRKVSPDGIITTVAGNGMNGDSGDGGQATSAQLDADAIAVDGAGNLFISEGNHARVRKVSPDGIITTVVSNVGFTYAVAVDSQGNLFIADELCDGESCYSIIQKLSSTGVLNTIAGVTTGDGGQLTGPQRCGGPYGLAVDGAGNVFTAEPFCHSIRKIAPDGTITTIAGGSEGYFGDGGLATNAALYYPTALAVDGAGNVYIADGADGLNQAVRVLRPASQSISAVVDAASQKAAPISPGKIVVIYGAGLGPSQLVQNQPSNGVFSTELSGTAVSFNGIAAPILYTSATQVAAIVPYSITGATAQVMVTYQGQVSTTFPVPVAASAPSLFTLNQTGAGQAAALNLDGKVNTAANPVKIGGFISLYATGEGQTSPEGVDGRLGGSNAAHPILPVSVTVGGIPATVQYKGGAQGLVAGLIQINVQIPDGVQPGGYVPVVLRVGDRSSGPAVWIGVGN